VNFRKQAVPEPGAFQIAPMVDVVFLLLIFFLVTWNFARY
jgi:biopolymer transport protein ExbD